MLWIELIGWIILISATIFTIGCWCMVFNEEPVPDWIVIIILLGILFGTTILPFIWILVFWEQWSTFWNPIVNLIDNFLYSEVVS